MKRVSRFVSLMISVIMCLSVFVVSADAADSEIKIILNGKTLEMSANAQLKDSDEGKIITVSLAEFAETFKAKLRYYNGERLASMQLGGTAAKLYVGRSTAVCGSRKFTMPISPYISGGKMYVPMCSLAEMLGAEVIYDDSGKTMYISSVQGKIPDNVSANIPVLMYHAVSDNPWGLKELFVKTSDMEAQIKYLVENGYTTITFEDLPYIDKIEKPVMLTFDDGYDDNYTDLFPILKKYNAKATIFVITGSIGGSHMMTEEQIKEMSDSGLVSIQSHTVSHPSMPSVTAAKLEKELLDSKLRLTRITGKIPFVLAYPNGEYSDSVISAMKDHYEYGLKKDGGIFTLGENVYKIDRTRISRSSSLGSFKSIVAKSNVTVTE